MKTRTTRRALLVAAALVIAVATPARAQGTGMEIGTSLVGLAVNWGDHTQTSTTLGIPSAGFGLVNPGVYVSVFAGSHIAVEPQIGLVFRSAGGHSAHALTVAGQVDYLLKGSRASSPYVFGSAGLLSASGAGPTPKFFSAGAGYRKLVGDRLTMRIDGRVTHFTDGLGNALVFGVSLGGVFK